MEMLGAIVLVFALQKIAALLSIPVILGMIWVKGKASRMDGEAWEQYFRQVSNRQYVVFLLVSYGIPLLLLSALGYCLYDFLSLTDPLILASLTFLFGIFHMIRKLDDHKRELWEKLRKLGMMRKKRRNDNRCASFLIKCKIKPVQTPNESQLGSIPFEFAQFGHDPLFPVPA